jgi:hypothetical protein
MEALWRRRAFNILISNTDDHLRNHSFLYAGQEGWRLSLAYYLNPVPTDIKPRIPRSWARESTPQEVQLYFGTLDAARPYIGFLYSVR